MLDSFKDHEDTSTPIESTQEEWLKHADELETAGLKGHADDIKATCKNSDTIAQEPPINTNPNLEITQLQSIIKFEQEVPNQKLKNKPRHPNRDKHIPVKKIQPLHPIAAVLAQQPDAFKNLVNHPDVISYLFHTPLGTITHELPPKQTVLSHSLITLISLNRANRRANRANRRKSLFKS